MRPTYFATQADLRQWLARNAAKAKELWVGYYKKGSGKPSITWPQSVDEALCFGWIDGIRKTLDEERYTIRFTPRRKGSAWSPVNVRRARALKKRGLMTPAGLAAFAERREFRSGIYSYETRPAELPEPYATEMRANGAAWAFFSAQSASYRRMCAWFVVSAKKDETRAARAAKLVEMCARGRRLV